MWRMWLSLALSCALLAAVTPRAGRDASAQAACTHLAFPQTAQPLLDAARPGDVICLAPGVFRGPLIIDSKSGVTVRGQGTANTVVAGGDRDSMLIFNSTDIVIENLKLFYGHPSNAYVWRGSNVVFRRIDAGGGGIGLHFDVGSIGTVQDSFVYAMEGDGVLTRRASNVTIERNWIFVNGGVGVSTVGETANTVVIHNVISDNAGPGIFAGQTPCALLPPAVVEIPECYLNNLRAFVGKANVILDTNVIQSSGSTGIVLFPGTRATMKGNRIWRNELTGLFAWGASFTSEGDEYAGNEEHAVEARAYPDPLKYPQVPSGERIRATGRINNAEVHDSAVLPETGTLGGGILAQGANMDVTNSRVYRNRGIGISYVNTSLGRITGNHVYDNGGSGICIFNAGNVSTSGNVLERNADDRVGVCRETTP